MLSIPYLSEPVLEKLSQYLVFQGSGVTRPRNLGPGVRQVFTSSGSLVGDLASNASALSRGKKMAEEAVIRKTLLNPGTLRSYPVIAGHSRGGDLLSRFLEKKPQLTQYIKKKYGTQFVGMGRPSAAFGSTPGLDLDLIAKRDPVPLAKDILRRKLDPSKVVGFKPSGWNPHSGVGYVRKLKQIIPPRKSAGL